MGRHEAYVLHSTHFIYTLFYSEQTDLEFICALGHAATTNSDMNSETRQQREGNERDVVMLGVVGWGELR